MQFSREDVAAIAELAKLALTDEELALYAEQLSACLMYFETLQQVDTSHIEPTASVLPLKNVMRKDEAGQPLSPAQVTANASDAIDNQFRVRAVLDSE
ncbi:MAG: Asp-tRNA(Asn)/Glu-tRNA(Gln) amidotransferase subunit GatC [Chloroflexi bacterium]|nr:MAG: Asp-tRNA(Asn)/Glu-tRNA(Gln) amidotransferase subunit GatC [Chloroflexota bacterium]